VVGGGEEVKLRKEGDGSPAREHSPGRKKSRRRCETGAHAHEATRRERGGMDGWRAAGEDARKGEEIGDERRQEERKKERFQEERSAARWSDDERQRTTRRGVGCGRRESVMRGG
jgi:hypothetical protein